MSEIKALGKLRAAGRNMAKGRNLENHEECNLLLLIADELEREIAEHYMELPLDADGVPVHVGDWMRHCDFIVQCAAVSPERVYYWDECKDGHWVMGVKCRHIKRRTLEDVLQDAGVSVAAIEDVAAEIRELMEVDA